MSTGIKLQQIYLDLLCSALSAGSFGVFSHEVPSGPCTYEVHLYATKSNTTSAVLWLKCQFCTDRVNFSLSGSKTELTESCMYMAGIDDFLDRLHSIVQPYTN